MTLNEININKLINNIIKIVYKKDNNIFHYKLITCSKIIDKNSNTKKEIYRIFIDNKLIKKNNPFRVHYKCINCDSINIVNFNNLVRKMNKGIFRCNMCKNLEEDKRNNHSRFMINTYKQNGYIKKKKKLIKKIKQKEDIDTFISNSILKFNLMDDDYKDDYFTKHLTKDEFNNIKDKIISIQNDKFTDINKFIYCPTIKIFNQTQFNPYLLDNERKVIEKAIYLKFKCDKCDSIGTYKNLYKFKNKIKLFCNTCLLCNKTFKIRSYKNIENQKITYQSKLELKFIKFCNKNNILIENGPTINYKWKNKDNLRYIVDFYIPKLNYLIECKDNHCWHKQQLLNGKWDCKMNYVNKLIGNKYNKFELIMSKNFMNKMKEIKKKYQNINKI